MASNRLLFNVSATVTTNLPEQFLKSLIAPQFLPTKTEVLMITSKALANLDPGTFPSLSPPGSLHVTYTNPPALSHTIHAYSHLMPYNTAGLLLFFFFSCL